MHPERIDEAVDAFVTVFEPDPSLDLGAFKAELRDVLFAGSGKHTIGEERITEQLISGMRVGAKYRLKAQSDLFMVIRNLTIVEGIVLRYCPTIDPVDEVKTITGDIMRRKVFGPSMRDEMTQLLPQILLTLSQRPRLAERLLRLERSFSEAKNLGLESEVIFGATLYTSDGGTAGGVCPMLTTVPPALNNLTDIDDLLTNNSPQGDTPTGESIDAVVQDLLNLPPNPEGPDSPPIIVVATDGEPDTCAVPNPQDGQPESVAAAEASYQAGIDLFILSVGSGVSDAHLQDMANAGVGLPVGGAQNAPYYVANNQGQLVDAFNEIIHGARSCEFVVEGIVDLARADEGTVVLNSQTLEFGTEWDMLDESTLVLLGTACDTFLTEDNVTMLANFPCGVVVQ